MSVRILSEIEDISINCPPLIFMGQERFPIAGHMSDGGGRIYFTPYAPADLVGTIKSHIRNGSHTADASLRQLPRLALVPRPNERRPQTLFHGAYIPPHERGMGLGSAMLGWLIERADEWGAPLWKTVPIHKPGTALLLASAGYEPVDRHAVAEILPPKDFSETTAVIRWLHCTLRNTDGRKVQQVRNYLFYDVVGNDIVTKHLWPSDPNNPVVAMHTSYRWPDRTAMDAYYKGLTN